jgi:hypothetical protein
MLRLVDNRNADPAIFRKACIAPHRAISVGFEVKIPDVDDLEPTPVAEGFVPRQAFNFVVFGEKASLESVLLPIARETGRLIPAHGRDQRHIAPPDCSRRR